MLGAARFVEDLVSSTRCMPQGVTEAGAVSTAFFAGKASMMLLSTGSLSFVRENMKQAYDVAFVPKNVRNAVPIGGGSLVMFARPQRGAAGGRLEVHQVADHARDAGRLEPLHRLLLAAQVGLRHAGDEGVHGQEPRRQGGARQLPYAKPWFATYQTVAVRKALEDEIQAVMNGKKKAARGGEGRAEEGRCADAALCRADGAAPGAVPPIPA